MEGVPFVAFFKLSQGSKGRAICIGLMPTYASFPCWVFLQNLSSGKIVTCHI